MGNADITAFSSHSSDHCIFTELIFQDILHCPKVQSFVSLFVAFLSVLPNVDEDGMYKASLAAS